MWQAWAGAPKKAAKKWNTDVSSISLESHSVNPEVSSVNSEISSVCLELSFSPEFTFIPEFSSVSLKFSLDSSEFSLVSPEYSLFSPEFSTVGPEFSSVNPAISSVSRVHLLILFCTLMFSVINEFNSLNHDVDSVNVELSLVLCNDYLGV
jgi:hypothetical protein